MPKSHPLPPWRVNHLFVGYIWNEMSTYIFLKIKTRQYKTNQDKTNQDNTRQDKTDKTRQDKTRQDKIRQDKTRQIFKDTEQMF